MNLRYFLLFITLKTICCYNPKRHVTPALSRSNLKSLKSKTPDPVIPARYKITSTTNYVDPSITQSFPTESFPAVEYPESILDSSKPFYISSSPFSNDVKSTFNSLVAKGNSKAKTATDYSWTQNEKSEDKLPALSQKVSVNEIPDIKGNEINSDYNNTNETLCKGITLLDVKQDAVINEAPYSDTDLNKLFTNLRTAECEEKGYVAEFINELSEVMKNLTIAETSECTEGDNNTAHAFESKRSNKFELSSDMTPNNNDSIIELNENSFLEEEHPERIRIPLFEDSVTNDALTSVTSLLNEYITNVTSVEDM